MIKGSSVTLRPIESFDAENYHHWINQEETNEWRGLYHPTTKEESREWIEKHRTSNSQQLNCSIYDESGVHIGFIGLQNICARSRRGELWIYIGATTHWGKGHGEDAVRALCQYAFSQMNLHRLWLECNPEFKNVVRCYEKVGFKIEGNLRDAYFRNGAFRNTCIMGILSSELLEARLS